MGRPPLQPAPPPLLAAGLDAGGNPCRLALTGWPMAAVPVGGHPLRAAARAGGRPLQVARPWPTAPIGGLAVASHLCMQTACMWPPLPRRQCLLSLPIAATRAEIVYPCIPDPDGEDERGQASSFLAVSTRWISAAKLLQSDLATLAQREGGE
ncbi:hypothetical protein GW17_00058553 [Ensete ventricosum]|nr:hypothetical protein GW17_00058553 [Ensete ventricosum]